MKNIPILFLALLVSSCMTQKRVYRYLEDHPLPSTTDTLIREVVHDTIIYRDTTIYITLPGEIHEDSVALDTGKGEVASPEPPEAPGWPYIEPPSPTPDTVKVSSSLATAKAWVDPRGYLHVKLKQYDTTLAIQLDSALAREEHFRELYLEVKKTQTNPVKVIPVIYRVALWLWVAVIVIFIILILLKRFRI